MAARGSAAKSATGASMSKYDVEVEARLQALEKAVAELKNHKHAAAPAAAGGEDALLRSIVRAMEPNYDHLAKKFGG
tara:strand:+ start:724 stop:954 length:231 start_codon:yes stop_codon:yes gene_type:complete